MRSNNPLVPNCDRCTRKGDCLFPAVWGVIHGNREDVPSCPMYVPKPKEKATDAKKER